MNNWINCEQFFLNPRKQPLGLASFGSKNVTSTFELEIKDFGYPPSFIVVGSLPIYLDGRSRLSPYRESFSHRSGFSSIITGYR